MAKKKAKALRASKSKSAKKKVGKVKAVKRAAAKKKTARKVVKRAVKATKKVAKTAKRATRPKAVRSARPARRTLPAAPPIATPVGAAPVVDVESAPPAPSVMGPAPAGTGGGEGSAGEGGEAHGSAPALDAELVTAGPEAGDMAPDFALPDETGRIHRLSDYRGKRVVLYFYPKDDTPGCTTEACGFRNRLGEFSDRDAVVLGVSPDPPASHQRFAQKYGLTFPLLADEDHRVAQQYGVWVEKVRYGARSMGIARTTFIIDRDGRIAHVFRNVRPEGHEQQVLDRLAT